LLLLGNAKEDDQWPGQPLPSLRSASGSRSTGTCRLSSDPAEVTRTWMAARLAERAAAVPHPGHGCARLRSYNAASASTSWGAHCSANMGGRAFARPPVERFAA